MTGATNDGDTSDAGVRAIALKWSRDELTLGYSWWCIGRGILVVTGDEGDDEDPRKQVPSSGER